ncbi:MAG: putative toxin-antitoxin system toxin component, PIN family [Pseudomonadota bacterium]|nr:putative toxin-antitoxin system toxin component, PIN family [Pseudomonadota bacterium]
MKIVLDSNVLLSGLAAPNSTPGRIITAWDNHSFEIVTCEFQLAEITRVMAYPKVRKLLQWGDSEIQGFIRQLCLRVEIVDISGIDVQVPADPDDSPILATLIAAEADCLVSGDNDLLALREEYCIESPAEFVLRL